MCHISLYSGMFARYQTNARTHTRVCMYIQTYIYIGRSVYTMHYKEGGCGGGDLPPMVCASCSRVPLFACPCLLNIYARPAEAVAPCRWYIVPLCPAEAVCARLCARCGCVSGLSWYRAAACAIRSHIEPLRRAQFVPMVHCAAVPG